MRLAKVHILHIDEMVDAQDSIVMVNDAFELRRNELSGMCSQRALCRHLRVSHVVLAS